jgi:hypothetical protein
MHYLLFLAALRWTTTTVIHIRYFERKQVLSTALALVPREHRAGAYQGFRPTIAAGYAQYLDSAAIRPLRRAL